ncbi:hypothetical protein HZI73_22175 [Vallitalea pronyensis]|uniref:Inositol-phosphate phosphatase n=1 Tax=Vallitalea pronyensis TaxID=1348613 RepID=A0A8J8MNA1_9FIRM|nr:inositol monophosphatase family protein [Vallitalea pronyensis]QUI24840.1 hypothetical protein HZI73_22175 [Vallitalea pronyensis]
MKEFIYGLADYVYDRVNESSGVLKNRVVNGVSPGGDAQFNIDQIAEDAVMEYVTKSNLSIAIYSEDYGLSILGGNPEFLLIVDPIDGTRPMAAEMGMSCISIAVARFYEDAKIKDIDYALLKELKSGATIYSDKNMEGIACSGYKDTLPNLNHQTKLENMFWTIEFNGHPAELMVKAYGDLINQSANTGGVFLFNSASYAISRIITGQLDAYVDIGNRILKDNPSLINRFREVGNGKVLHLFPYDIAASVYLAQKAGVIITDAYGESLDETLLTELGYHNQQSCIAASTHELHKKILDQIKW